MAGDPGIEAPDEAGAGAVEAALDGGGVGLAPATAVAVGAAGVDGPPEQPAATSVTTTTKNMRRSRNPLAGRDIPLLDPTVSLGSVG